MQFYRDADRGNTGLYVVLGGRGLKRKFQENQLDGYRDFFESRAVK